MHHTCFLLLAALPRPARLRSNMLDYVFAFPLGLSRKERLMKKFCTLLAALGYVAGCAADGAAGREGSPVWFMRTTPAEQAAYFQSVCVTYGFKPNTPQMAQCIQTEATNTRSSARKRMQDISNSNTTTNTTCTGFGNTLNCTSRTY